MKHKALLVLLVGILGCVASVGATESEQVLNDANRVLKDALASVLKRDPVRTLEGTNYDLSGFIGVLTNHPGFPHCHDWYFIDGVVKEILDDTHFICVVDTWPGDSSDTYIANVSNIPYPSIYVDGSHLHLIARESGRYSYLSGGVRKTVKSFEYGKPVQPWDKTNATPVAKVDCAEEAERIFGNKPKPASVAANNGPDAEAQQEILAQQKEAERQRLAAKAKKEEMDKKVLAYQISQAQKGVAYAQFELGLRYISGTGVATNVIIGRDWISKAAAQGDSQALRWLSTNTIAK